MRNVFLALLNMILIVGICAASETKTTNYELNKDVYWPIRVNENWDKVDAQMKLNEGGAGGWTPTATSDLEMGTFSVDGDSAAGISFDPDNDGTNEILFNTDGSISLSGADDSIGASTGYLKLQGFNNINNEDLTFDFETKPNKVVLSSSTGVTALEFTTNVIARDIITGTSYGNIAGLVAKYLAEENAANTSVDNAEGAASLDCIASTNTNNLSVVGKLGNAFNFSSANNEILDCGNSSTLKLSGNFSIEFWMKTSTTGTTRRIMGNRSSSGNNIGLQMIQISTGEVRFSVDTGASIENVQSTSTVTDGNWKHVVAVKSGTDLAIYVNSIDEGVPTGVISGDSGSGAANFLIGNDPFSGEYYNGDLDNIRLWDISLTSANVAALYNSGAGTLSENGDSAGCIMLYDIGASGWEECFVTSGTFTCTSDADGVCDGS